MTSYNAHLDLTKPSSTPPSSPYHGSNSVRPVTSARSQMLLRWRAVDPSLEPKSRRAKTPTSPVRRLQKILPPPDQHYCVAKSPVGRLMPCVYVRRRRQLDAVEERPLTNGRANPAHVVGAPQQRGGREVPDALTICVRSTIRMGILDGNSCMSVHLHEGSRGEQSAVLFGGGGAGRCYLSSTVI